MNSMAFVDRLVVVLEAANIPYAIVGGLAAIAWGVPRFTQDVDLVAELPANLDDLFRLGEQMRAAGLTAMEPDHFAEVAAVCVEHGSTLSFMTPAVEKIDRNQPAASRRALARAERWVSHWLKPDLSFVELELLCYTYSISRSVSVWSTNETNIGYT